MAVHDLGKVFEREVHDAFRFLSDTLPVKWERPVDSHEAGNLVRAQDCDFKLTVKSQRPGQPYQFYFECKTSTQYASLKDGGAVKSVLRGASGQVGRLRKCQRAGIIVLYLFHQPRTQRVELWDAHPLLLHTQSEARTKFTGDPLETLTLKNLPQLAVRICQHPNTFLQTILANRKP